MAARLVNCVRLQKEAEGLSEPPFAGELGQEIFQKVSLEVWKQWQDDMMIKVINEYRLDMSNEKDYAALIDQMRAFLNLGSDAKVLEVENAARGKGEAE